MFKHGRGIAGILVACILALVAYSFATERSTESVTEAIAKGSWEVWDELVHKNTNATKAIVKGLRIVAEDDKRDNEERIYAIVLLGKTGSEEQIDFLLENIALKLTKRDFDNDDDEEKQHPCWYALKSMGWQVVPHALEFMWQKRSAEELELLAQLFERVCGANMSKAILQAKLQEAQAERRGEEIRSNIRQVLSHLSEPLRGGGG